MARCRERHPDVIAGRRHLGVSAQRFVTPCLVGAGIVVEIAERGGEAVGAVLGRNTPASPVGLVYGWVPPDRPASPTGHLLVSLAGHPSRRAAPLAVGLAWTYGWGRQAAWKLALSVVRRSLTVPALRGAAPGPHQARSKISARCSATPLWDSFCSTARPGGAASRRVRHGRDWSPRGLVASPSARSSRTSSGSSGRSPGPSPACGHHCGVRGPLEPCPRARSWQLGYPAQPPLSVRADHRPQRIIIPVP